MKTPFGEGYVAGFAFILCLLVGSILIVAMLLRIGWVGHNPGLTTLGLVVVVTFIAWIARSRKPST